MTILGTVDIRDVDLGCMNTIGASVVTYSIDGGTRGQYVVNLSGVNSDLSRYGGKIPVFFDAPNDSYQDYVLPSYVFRQNSCEPAFDRQPYVGVVARGPSRDAVVVHDDYSGTDGYSKYVEQIRGDPYDVGFDLLIHARRKQELNRLVKHVMGVMRPPWFSFKIIDSLGDIREYDAGEVSYSNASELADIADRTASWSLSFTVRAEIDTFEDVCSTAMIDPRYTIQVGVQTEG